MFKKDYEKITGDDDNDSSAHPANSANFFSLWTFWWMNRIFRTGNQRPLNQSDFLPLNEEDRTRSLTEQLEEHWNNHIQQCNITTGRKPKLWKCVLKMISCKEALFLLSFWFIDFIYRVITPLVLGLLLLLLSSAQRDYALVYGCCFILGLAGVVSSITHYSAFRSDLLGMRLSSAIKGLVYHKVGVGTYRKFSVKPLSFGAIIYQLLFLLGLHSPLPFPSQLKNNKRQTVYPVQFYRTNTGTNLYRILPSFVGNIAELVQKKKKQWQLRLS